MPPFPVVVVSLFLLGFGMAINLAPNNVFGVNLARGTVILGFMHGKCDVGGTVAPLVVTSMVSKGIQWSAKHPMVTLLPNTSVFDFGWYWLCWVDVLGLRKAYADSVTDSVGADSLAPGSWSKRLSKIWVTQKSHQGQNNFAWGSLHLCYQDAEVAISGRVISFLIKYRNRNPAQVGYVTAGF
ncbi:hypothetical protein GJ744_006810 [Endocarpon pusillum]|uniref:Phosphate transporter n=1 Tax=Endocarpon pusillum TaxID=364733 RepID=A0A8H7ALE8_9EURO|nr:hypothetical protein GJ744_006810 [Endocarpon pusillum]